MSIVQSLVANLIAIALTTASFAAIMWCVEQLFPQNKVSIASQLRSLSFWAIAGVGTATAITLYGHVRGLLQPRPLFIIPLKDWLAKKGTRFGSLSQDVPLLL